MSLLLMLLFLNPSAVQKSNREAICQRWSEANRSSRNSILHDTEQCTAVDKEEIPVLCSPNPYLNTPVRCLKVLTSGKLIRAVEGIWLEFSKEIYI